MSCDIVEVGKRRDGGSRYWCLRHGANATAKYGVAAPTCVAADDAPISDSETLRLIPSDYAGGVALWGAVPPVYDTTSFPLDRGVHVHARNAIGAQKVVDTTYRRVMLPLQASLLTDAWTTVDEIDAINFMVSSVFDIETITVVCPRCGTSHLDRDWFAVHPHRRHLCHGCGRHFSDSVIGVGNPVALIRGAFSLGPRVSSRATERLSIRQADFPGGLQIWGSNPAIVWTSTIEEKIGIHVHAYDAQARPIFDGTFDSVTIDGVELEADQVRTYMAQLAMPHIADRVTSASCICGASQFDTGKDAYTPSGTCRGCGEKRRSSSRYQNIIANPIVDQISHLEKLASRSARRDRLNLRAEAI